jgi:hypothetical protein
MTLRRRPFIACCGWRNRWSAERARDERRGQERPAEVNRAIIGFIRELG